MIIPCKSFGWTNNKLKDKKEKEVILLCEQRDNIENSYEN